MSKKKTYTKGLKRAFERYRWWDYMYMIEMERAIWKHWADEYGGLAKTRDWGSSGRVAAISRLALSLIDVYIGTSIEPVDPNDEIKTEWDPSTNMYRVIHVPEYKLKSGKHVNMKNAYRFLRNVGYTPRDADVFSIDETRRQKAWYLYHKLKAYYLQECWD